MAATKRERLDEIYSRLLAASPFPSGDAARAALDDVMTTVEDEFSGVPSNPNATTTDGRMYPPDNRFEIASGSPHVRTFKHLRHRTSFGENGAIRISFPDGTVELDLPGVDGRFVRDLFSETNDELH